MTVFISDPMVKPEIFWKMVNNVAERAMRLKTSFNHELKRDETTNHLRTLKVAYVVRNDEEWLTEVFTAFDPVALRKAERLLQPYGSVGSYNPYYEEDGEPLAFEDPYRTRQPPPPPGAPTRKPIKQKSKRQLKRDKRNADIQARRDAMRSWWADINGKLKTEHLNKFKSVCGFYHMDECTAKTNARGNCTHQRTKEERMHKCVCGGAHKMVNCAKKIWK
eukprot:475256_1